MKKYDVITIFRDGTELETAQKSVRDILSRNNVELIEEDDWGNRRLNHEIDKIESARYIRFHCKIDPQQVKSLTHELQIDLNVLRFMVSNG